MAKGANIADDKAAGVSPSEPHTLGHVIETMGVTVHHWHVVSVACWCSIMMGWTAVAGVFLLDAAGQTHSAWIVRASIANKLEERDKALALLMGGVLAIAMNPIIGCLGDVLGRIKTIELGVWLCALVALGMMLAPDKHFLMATIALNPFTKDGIMPSLNSLLAEWMPTHCRTTSLVALHISWNIGRLLVTVLWVWLPPSANWTAFFSVVASLPLLIGMFLRVFGGQYESPRFLAVHGDWDSCISNLRVAAKWHASILPVGWDNVANLKLETTSGLAVKAQQWSFRRMFSEFQESEVWKVTLLMGVCVMSLHYAATGTLYWLIDYLNQIHAKPAVKPAMLVAPLGKMLGNIMLIIGGPNACMIEKCPRVQLLQVGFIGTAVCALALCGTTEAVLIPVVVFFFHFFEEVIWTSTFVFMAEAFPTTVRTTATGVITMFGSCGAVASAALTSYFMHIWVYMPIFSICTTMVISLIVSSFLPETLHKKFLSDTIGYGTCP